MKGETALETGRLVFPPLARVPWLLHGFTLREREVAVDAAREEVIARLGEKHRRLFDALGIEWGALRLSEQVHGNHVALVGNCDPKSKIRNPKSKIPDADGLVTSAPGVPLGVYVADCCAIFLVETRARAIGLLHSGRRGTAQNIARAGLKALLTLSGGAPANVLAVLGPCIHGCCYDVDFVAQIEGQLRAEGVKDIWRHPDCTGCHRDRYYSYRRDKGRTGRMLAFAMIRAP